MFKGVILINKILVLVLALLLASCGGPFTRIEKPEYIQSDKGYALDAPVGWVQSTAPQVKDEFLISRDGFGLQFISVKVVPIDKAYSTLKKSASVATLPSDLAEAELAEFKAKSPNAPSIVLLDNTLANVAGKKAFKLHLKYLNQKGLRFERESYGFATDKFYYTLSYEAPSLHYFERDRGLFEKMVNSFKFKS